METEEQVHAAVILTHTSALVTVHPFSTLALLAGIGSNTL